MVNNSSARNAVLISTQRDKSSLGPGRSSERCSHRWLAFLEATDQLADPLESAPLEERPEIGCISKSPNPHAFLSYLQKSLSQLL